MFKLLTTTAIVAAILVAWLAAAAVRSQPSRPAARSGLTPQEAVIELHRQLHRHLVWVVVEKIEPAIGGRVDRTVGRTTTSCDSIKNPAEA